MGMNKNNTNDAAPGDYDTWAASNKVRIFTVSQGKNTGEPKGVISLMADVGGTVEQVDVMVTLDPNSTTHTGKKRINFTIDAFAAIGAVNAMAEIGAAIEADPTCAAVELSGVFDAAGKPLVLATLHVSTSGEFTNYDLWAKRKPVAKGLGAALAALGAKNGQASVPAVNPFSKPAAEGGDASFAFGANVTPSDQRTGSFAPKPA